MEGSWTTPQLFSTEPAKNSNLFIFFIIIGKFASLFHLSQWTAYHLTRIVSMELYFIGIYLLCSEIVQKKHAFWARRCGFGDKVPDQSYYCKFLGSLDMKTITLINLFLVEELVRVGILTRNWIMDSSPLEALSYDNEGRWGYVGYCTHEENMDSSICDCG